MDTLKPPQSGKALVICEKPSVASDLLSAFGGGSRKDGYFEFSLGYITWCFGHLVELVPPAGYNPEWEKWEMSVLPMVPEKFGFKYGVSGGYDGGKGAKKQLGVIGDLLKQADYLVNATDAGREGELIFWEAAKFAGWGKDKPAAVPGSKPCYRFWSNKMTAEALRGSWNEMKPISEYLPLARAAYCRSESDWLLGINLTRAATKAFPRKWGPEEDDKVKVWSVGRVQTPVLALIVRRDLTIENFVSKAFYEVRLDCRDSKEASADSFGAVLQVPDGVKIFDRGDEEGASKSKSAFSSKEDAQRVLDEILSRSSDPWSVVDEVVDGVENPPGLFSLTDLQRWANQAWGWTAQKTLTVAQAAYEEEKVLTYPRTTSSFLPEDSKSEMDSVHSWLRNGWLGSSVPGFPDGPLPKPSASPRASYLFDDSKVSDHYAIVPTGEMPKDLSSDVGKLWMAVVRRFVTAFALPAKVRSVKRSLSLDGFQEGTRKAFCSGKTYVDRGWLAYDDVLSALTGGVRKSSDRVLANCGALANVLSGVLHEGATSPPRAFDEASLLAVMENISAKLTGEDLEEGVVSLDELKEALSDLGLGTPATRADIIETLLSRGFISRAAKGVVPKAGGGKAAPKAGKGAPKYLCSTPSGRYLIAALEKIQLKYLTEALLTAQWEKRLSDMATGKSDESREAFLSSLVDSLKDAVAVFSKNAVAQASRAEAKEIDVLCPKTGSPVKDFGGWFVFPGLPEIRLWKKIAERDISAEEFLPLVSSGKTDLLEGFLSKEKKKFSAHLVLENGKLSFQFPERSQVQGTVVPGVVCPKSGDPVQDCGKFYRFPGYPKAAFWKEIAKRPVTAQEYALVLKDGKSGLLEGFVSSKGSKFSAFLVFKASEGKVVFDFPPREGSGNQVKREGGSIPKGKKR